MLLKKMCLLLLGFFVTFEASSCYNDFGAVIMYVCIRPLTLTPRYECRVASPGSITYNLKYHASFLHVFFSVEQLETEKMNQASFFATSCELCT